MTISRNYACKRLSALGLKQGHVHAIIDAVELWSKQSGVEWTVDRLKNLKTHLLHRLAGDGEETLSWVASRGGVPKGPFRRLYIDIDTPRKRARALNALMVYTSYVSTEVTPKQWRKFSGSVEQSVTTSEAESLETLGFRVWFDTPGTKEALGIRPLHISPESWTAWPDIPWESRGTRVPLFGKDKVRTVAISAVDQWYRASESNPWVRWYFGAHPRLAQSIELSRAPVLSDWVQGEPREGCVGKVSFIQEPGFKLRAVANPDPLVQLSLEPLKRGLLDLLKVNVRDCTHDQDSGVQEVQRWLADGEVVHSIDLSDATNNFPLSLQRLVLDAVCPVGAGASPLYYGLNRGFIAAATGPWIVHDPIAKHQRVIRWTKGQPLGLGPSFPLFAMAHHALVQYAMSMLSHDNMVRSDYRILGDDIAIKGDALASRYRELLGIFGCPVSEAKCLVSNQVAEFAGKVILRDEILTTFKWRQVSDRNFLDVCRALGLPALGLLRPQQRVVARALASIPEWYGGLGFNPRGESLETRTLRAVELGLLEDSANRVVKTEAASLRVRNLINSGARVPRPAWPWETVNPFTGEDRILAAAPATRAPARDVIGTLADAGQRLDRPDPGTIQSDIAHELGIRDVKLDSGTPLPGYVPTGRQGGDPRGPSTLETYQRLLSSSSLQVNAAAIFDAFKTARTSAVEQGALPSQEEPDPGNSWSSDPEP